jgi:hypothetical protein
MGDGNVPKYSKKKIKQLLKSWDTGANNAVRGKAFEELARYLFSKVPGVTVISWNEMNTFETEEIDVACATVPHPRGLRDLGGFFLVECKGWDSAVNSEQVAWFLTKIKHRGVSFGVLFAANGITGVEGHLTRSHFLVAMALAEKIKMVIETRDEIETLNTGEELATLIIEKITRLHATGGRCY